MARAEDTLRYFDDTQWLNNALGTTTRSVESLLESGHVLCFPHLPFVLTDREKSFLDPRYADPQAKNISLRGAGAEMRGAVGTADELAALRAMVLRFREQACGLTARLFPHYQGRLTLANTSYRPVSVVGRQTSWRKDDTRLHVDAFPSNPSQGLRLLRVFTNVHPVDEPRVWRVGEDFEAFARAHLNRISRPWPGSAWLMERLHITKRRRTEFDHLMLGLHDAAKADLAWQRDSEQREVRFAPGTTWVVFSDQVLHAAMSGQFMMEQTFTLHPGDQLTPGTSPLHILERMTGRALLA